ncbi:hypothetical protein CMK14_27285 [Candidatus Poribacteria bacterium]|nr:hypothetical protein [Candidatus Poribacteria bacterium]
MEIRLSHGQSIFCPGEIGYQVLIYLVTNMKEADSVGSYYRKRFSIETLFPIRKAGDFISIKAIYPSPIG